jgi:gluconolactonase
MGHHLGTIVMPEQAANLTWGDKDFRGLCITATSSVYRLRTKVRGFVPTLNACAGESSKSSMGDAK